MKPDKVKQILFSRIDGIVNSVSYYSKNPETDFKRNRKLPFRKVLTGIIGMGGTTLSNELLDMFDYSSDSATASAFVQQREKIKVEAFEALFRSFSSDISSFEDCGGMRLLAADGSDIQFSTNAEDKDSYFPGTNGQKPYNLLHLNALYDLNKHLYLDAVIQKRNNYNEHRALTDMVERSCIKKALVVADRGYESYNNMAHIQEKGWKFLIRVKDGCAGIKSSLVLPDKPSYDVEINLSLTRKQTNDIKELLKDKNHYRFIPSTTTFDYLPLKNRKSDKTAFYNLSFRVVRFRISDDAYETVLTNLDAADYPPDRIKRLYAARWGIETSFRDLKYTVGMLNFHSKKVTCIQQEIFARLIMYNFSEMITSHVVIDKKEKKYTYKANFTVSVHICRAFFRGKTASPDVEAVIARNVIPVRPDRHRKRNMITKAFVSFLYRIA